jgi:hypothetical protein
LKVTKPGELATWRAERARAANVRRTEVTEEIKCNHPLRDVS